MALRLDSHQHFWHYNETDYSWLAHNILKQDYLPAYLEPYLRDNGFHGTIAVQTCQTERETDFLLQLKSQSSFIKGVVGWIDLEAESLRSTLSRYAGKVSGFRLSLAQEADGERMLGASLQRGIRMLDDFSYTVDLLVRPHQLKNCARLADKFPRQSFVIDHLAKPDYSETGFESWASDIKNLSERKNVFCKISGMVTELPPQDPEADELAIDPYLPYLDQALEHFTPQRLMFGSDWPLCTLTATFDEVYDITNLFISKLSTHEQDLIMGECAATFYNLARS
jgi:L-fuconolactonase